MDAETDVLVVGAGPVGLTAAVELHRRGVSVRIVDQLAAPLPYAKAVGVQPRTLEIWAAMGLVRQALDAAVPMRGQIAYVNGAEAGRLALDVPPDVPYGFVALPQYETERILTGYLSEHGVEVERGLSLTSFAQDAQAVTARLAGAAGQQVVRARYLVGCDGAHSTVRRGLGLAFLGDAFPEQYMLGDVEVDWSLPPGWAVRAMHQTDGKVDDLLVCIPLPGRGRYRMSMLVPPDLQTPAARRDDVAHGLEADRPAPTLGHIQAVLDRLAPEPTTAANMRWSSVFRISHRLVERYSVGRVFLAGDAAHVHPPTGAQGMNTGIQDAWNLAWKLALAVHGAAAADLLDSYSRERWPVGEEVVARTVRHAREGFDEDASDASLPIRREAQLLVGYRGSAWVGRDLPPGAADNPAPAAPAGGHPGAGRQWGSGPQPGDRAPDARELRRPVLNFAVRLFELTGGLNHVLLGYVETPRELAALEAAAQCARQCAHSRLDTYVVIAADAAALADGCVLPFVVDSAGEFRAAYHVTGGSAVLVRPDGYLGYRTDDVNADRLAAYLARVFAVPADV
ncbi:MAG: FAD-dependent monooxygenase [Frankiaceae bacterium]